MLGNGISTLFANPFFAVLLGLTVGALISWANRYGAGFMTPDDKTGAGFAAAMGIQMGGMLLACGLVFGYHAVAPDATVQFGVSLVASILVVTVLASLPGMRATGISNRGR